MTGFRPGGPEFDRALSAFQASYPAFSQTAILGSLRAWDYPRLDEQGLVYLDYAASGLCASSQLRAHITGLQKESFKKHHLLQPDSAALQEDIAEARASVLSFFNASPAEYTAIFTHSAGRAIELVGQLYPFSTGSHFLYGADSHRATGRVRELARARGAAVTCAPLAMPDLALDPAALQHALGQADAGVRNLFLFVAQSSFSGVQHPLELIEEAQRQGWDVMLDATAYAPTNPLDLSRWQPEFVSVSLQKISGYPPDTGCLIARHGALARLQASTGRHCSGVDKQALDGPTLNQLNMPAVTASLKHIRQIGLDLIQRRTAILTTWLLQHLLALHHENGRPLVHLYGPGDMLSRGPTLTMNLVDPEGELHDAFRVGRLAGASRISIHTSCFGHLHGGQAGERAARDQRERLLHTHPLPAAVALENGYLRAAAVTRASIGLVSNFADVYKFFTFVRTFLNQPAGTIE